MTLTMIIVISVVFVVGLVWLFIRGADDREFCEQCGEELDGNEYEEGYCNICNYYNNGGL